jgi:hypothetical protein
MQQTSSEAIVAAEEKLQDALAASVPGHEWEWTVDVTIALVRMERALREHKEATEGLGGLFAYVNELSAETLPTMQRREQKLCEDHESFLHQAKNLKEEVQKALEVFRPHRKQTTPAPAFSPSPASAMVPDFGHIRQRGEQFLTSLREHREAETKLLFESALTDVGVGD